METKFQTSFIPKRPMQPTSGLAPMEPRNRPSSGGAFMVIAVGLFILSLLAIGGAYLWNQYLLSAQNGYKQQLATREQQFNVDLISQLEGQSLKIAYARQLISNHIAASKIFSIVSSMTAQNVIFLSMNITGSTGTGGNLSVSLSGYGKDFSTVAFQSDVLSQLRQYGLGNIVKNPFVSNPSLNQNGTVSFGLSFSLNPSSLKYSGTAASASPAASPSAGGQSQ